MSEDYEPRDHDNDDPTFQNEPIEPPQPQAKITVHLTTAVGIGTNMMAQPVQCDAGADIFNVLASCGVNSADLPALQIRINGQASDLQTPLRDGDRVLIVPAKVSGGRRLLPSLLAILTAAN